MADQARASHPERETVKETGALVLAIGGVAAAFGAASCCALPMLLGGFGLGTAWLAGIAFLAAPHRIALVAAATACLVGAGGVLASQRRAIACAPGTVCGHRGVMPLVMGFLSLGAALAIAGLLFA